MLNGQFQRKNKTTQKMEFPIEKVIKERLMYRKKSHAMKEDIKILCKIKLKRDIIIIIIITY